MSKYACEDLALASAITGYGVLDLSPSDLVEKIASDIAQVRAEEREKVAELVEHCGVALTWFNANTAEKNRWISGEALAAIQKAKEKR